MSKEEEKYNLLWDEKNNILRVVFVGKGHDEMLMKKLFDEVEEILEKQKGKKEISIFIDLKKLEEHISPEARKVAVDFLSKKPIFNKIAAVTSSMAIKVVVNFVMRASGKKNIRFFDEEEEAIRWLNESV